MIDGREQWLEARKTGLGGSEIAAVIGENPWCSPYTLFCRKLELIPDIVSTKRMEWGSRHEVAIAKWYEEETGRFVLAGKELIAVLAVAVDEPDARVRRELWGHFYLEPEIVERVERLVASIEKVSIIELYGDTHVLLRHRDSHWMIGTPDAFFFDEEQDEWGVLEIKCSEFRNKGQWSEGPPSYYMAQIQSYQALTGLRHGAFGVLFGFWESGHIDVPRDDEMIERMAITGAEFWLRCKTGDAPELDESANTHETIRSLYPEGNEELPVKAFPDDAEDWDRMYLEHKTAEKMHAKKKKAMETLIRAEMGEHTEAELPSGVRWVSPS